VYPLINTTDDSACPTYDGTFSKKRKRDKPGLLSSKNLKNITPLTQNQKLAFTSWSKGLNLILNGFPGVGKTLLALFLALRTVLDPNTPFDRIIIVRSLVETRKMGFLPGTKEEKQKDYETPYKQICQTLFKDETAEAYKDIYEVLKAQKRLEFVSTTFLRGVNMYNAVVVVDEMQNLNFHELDTAMTRLNEGCRIIFSGDYHQSDLVFNDERSGILNFLKILQPLVEDFDTVSFTVDDCVRSGLVRRYLIAREAYIASLQLTGK
jgi:predicted ribonuclease YlaK